MEATVTCQDRQPPRPRQAAPQTLHLAVRALLDSALRTGRRRARHSGYSLLEILVVLAIIGLIAGTTALALFKFIPEARIKTTRESARTIRNAAHLYRMEHGTGECPSVALLRTSQMPKR